MTNRQTFIRSWVLLLLIVGGALLSGCALGGEKKSDSGNISMKLTISDTKMQLPSQKVKVYAAVKNLSDRNLEIDLRANIIDGMHFLGHTFQLLSQDGRVASRAGIPIGPDESRNIEFDVALDKSADPGTYYVEVTASTPNRDDQVSSRVRVEILPVD